MTAPAAGCIITDAVQPRSSRPAPCHARQGTVSPPPSLPASLLILYSPPAHLPSSQQLTVCSFHSVALPLPPSSLPSCCASASSPASHYPNIQLLPKPTYTLRFIPPPLSFFLPLFLPFHLIHSILLPHFTCHLFSPMFSLSSASLAACVFSLRGAQAAHLPPTAGQSGCFHLKHPIKLSFALYLHQKVFFLPPLLSLSCLHEAHKHFIFNFKSFRLDVNRLRLDSRSARASRTCGVALKAATS